MPKSSTAHPGAAARVAGPLSCPSCGAAVPLGEGDELECPYCSARVPVPADYRALREAQREEGADRARAEALYEKLGHAPPPLLRRWANLSSPLYRWVTEGARGLLRLGWMAVLIALISLTLLGHWAAPRIGIDVIDVVGGEHLYGGLCALFAVVAVLPVAAAGYLDQFVKSRAALQRSLAAGMPEQPGGPSTCRRCGAPLHVPAGALGVRCVYCSSDNLVALPHDWVEQASRFEHKEHETIQEAVESQRADGSAAKWLLLRRLGLGFGSIAVLGYAGMWAQEAASIGEAIPWSQAFTPGRRLLPVWNGAVAVPIHRPTRLRGNSLDERPGFLAALHGGEYLVLSSATLGADVDVAVTNNSHAFRWAKHPAWEVASDGRYHAVFRAPYTGYFFVQLEYSTPPSGDAELEWSTAAKAPPHNPPKPPDVHVRKLSPGHGQVRGLAFSPDSHQLAVACADGTTTLFDTETGAKRLALQSDPPRAVAWRPGAAELAIATDHAVVIEDTEHGESLRSLETPASSVRYSPDGQWLADAGADAQLRVYAAGNDYKLSHTLEGDGKPPGALCFAPWSGVIAAAGADREVRFLELGKGRQVDSTLVGEPLDALAWSPDGRWLLGGGKLQTIRRVWVKRPRAPVVHLLGKTISPENPRANDVTGREYRGLVGHRGRVLALTFIPHTSLFVASSSDKTVRLWDIHHGRELGTLLHTAAPVRNLAASSDGRSLAVGVASDVELVHLPAGRAWNGG